MKKHDPPVLLQRFFHWFCKATQLEGLEGDLFELFDRRVKSKGLFMARLMYVWDMLSLMRPSVARQFPQNSNRNAMGIIRNYLKTAFRLAWKSKNFAAINLLGLTLGITSVTYIALYVHDELSHDDHISNADQKYRLYNIVSRESGVENKMPMVPPVFTPHLKANYPQFARMGRIAEDYGGTLFKVGERSFKENRGIYAEIDALKILNIELIYGSYEDLNAPRQILLSETTFHKFFGAQPFNKQVVELTNQTRVEIVGVYKDLPERSHLSVDYIISFDWLLAKVPEERMNAWIWQQFYTYFELQEGVDPKVFEKQIQEHIATYAHPIIASQGFGFTYTPHFQKIRDIHLHSVGFEHDLSVTSSFQSILFLGIAACIILFIAGLNFVNLTMALAIKRAKEVGIRKFVGATRTQLILQYGIETGLYYLIAGVLSVAVLVLGLDYFNQFAGKSFTLSEVFTFSNMGWFGCAMLLLIVCSGWYPAILTSRLKTTAILHGASVAKIRLYRSYFRLDTRQVLVGAQYVLSIGLVLLSLIFNDQYHFLRNTDMGFNKENLIYTALTGGLKNDLDATRNSFSSHSDVEDVSFCFGIPGGIVAVDGAFFPTLREKELSTAMVMADHNYIDIMGMHIEAGRNFSKDLKSDQKESFIINETAVNNLGLKSSEEAIGQQVRWKMWTDKDTFKTGRVIGVVSDFNYKSLHHEVENVIMHVEPNNFSFMVVKLSGNNPIDAIQFLEDTYKQYEPDRPFEFEFIDRSFADFYAAEKKISQLFTFFTILAILTAAFGLYGLVSFSIVNRMKEISIRKILGAGTRTIFMILVNRYFLLVFVAMLVSMPMSWYLANEWLANFANRIDVDVFLFLKVASISVLLTLLAVGYQALHGASANPADQLRNE